MSSPESGSGEINNDISLIEDLIFRISRPKLSRADNLQLLALKLIIMLWENEDDNLEKMEEKLNLIDDIRHELSFLRAEYYKKIFTEKAGLNF